MKDFTHPTEKILHASAFYLKDGHPALSVHDANSKAPSVMTGTTRFSSGKRLAIPGTTTIQGGSSCECSSLFPISADYSMEPDQWHFVAFSIDVQAQKGILVQDDKVGVLYLSAIFIRQSCVVYKNRNSRLPTIITFNIGIV